MLLAIDTTLNACSATLFDDVAGRIVASRFAAMERGHAEALGPMVEALFAEINERPDCLSRIAVTVGPGTFTGLRIGLSFAKGMALALNVPLVGITSLQATAAAHMGASDHVLVVHQAGGTGLFYWSSFDGKTAEELARPSVASAEEIAAAVGSEACALVGTGAESLHKLLPHHALLVSRAVPDAAYFAAFAATLPADGAAVEPLYLRPPDAKPSVSVAASSARVREATAGDLAVMADIHAASFPTGWDVRSLTAILAVPGAGALVVELAGTVYGFVQFQWVAGEAEINTICVLPNYRRQHFGDDLMKGLVAYLKQHATSKLFLEVAEDNRAARALYEKFGFATSGLRKAYYADGQNAVTMVKEMVD